MNKYIELFLSFLKIGATTFGGGYAMVPIIKDEVVEKKKWLNNDELLEIIAIAESTPGPIAINTSTFVGYKRGGIFGSVCSTLGCVIPSFIIVFILSFFFNRFINNEIVSYAFLGIKSAVCFLIIKAALGMIKKTKKTFFNVFIISFITILMIILDFYSKSFSSIYLIIIGGFFGFFYYSIKEKTK